MDFEKHSTHMSRFDAIMNSIEMKFDILLMMLSEKFKVDNNGGIENNSFNDQEIVTPEIPTTNCDGRIAFDDGRLLKQVEQHLFEKSPLWASFCDEELPKNAVESIVGMDDLEMKKFDFNFETTLQEGDVSAQEYQEIAEQVSHEVVYPSNVNVGCDSPGDLQLQQYFEPLQMIPQKGLCLEEFGNIACHLDGSDGICLSDQIDKVRLAIIPRCMRRCAYNFTHGKFFQFDTNSESRFHDHGGQQLPSNFTRGAVLDLLNRDFYDFENSGRLKFFEELKRVEIGTEGTKSIVKPWVQKVTGFKGGTIVEGITKSHLQRLSKSNQNMTSLDYRNIDPVAVVSLLLSALIEKIVDPAVDPVAYGSLVFTGTFQALFGIFSLGFLFDFLSNAAIVGLMGGAAIIIGLQQLKGLLGISHFTTTTDIVYVLEAIFKSLHPGLSPLNFILGCSFLISILITRFIGRQNRKFFWLPAIAPLLSVILSTLIVYLTKADKHGVNSVKHFKGGLNIVLLDSPLSTKKEEEWQEIIESCQASPNLGENYDLIPLSYNDLPANLKLYLIYMVLFPKEFDTPVRRLQSLWLAEGFVKRSKKPSDTFQEDVVKRYFDNLVKRSLIQVSKLTSDGRPKRCRLLGVLHDHLSPKARVISLFHVHHKYSDTSCQDAGPFCVCRLVEYTDIKNCSLYPSQLGSLRSYLSFNIQKKDTPATEVGKLLSNILSNGLGLLRVLDLEGVYKLSLPNNLGDFFHLRYLVFRWTFLDSLPESVDHLHYLETLDIKHTHINTLPSFIWKMKHLKHLYANGIHLDLPRHLCSSFPQLLSLWGFSVDDSSLVTDCLNSLVHLRELGITFQLSNSYEIRD